MPKRATHGRPPKSRNRPRRPPPQPQSRGASTAQTFEGSDVAVAEAPIAQPSTSTLSDTVAARPRRGSSTLRKAPGVVINYQYLRRDIKQLTILAPSMIVLLVLAFIFLH